MTAASFSYARMDLLHPEDTMDLASSPRMPADDFDLPYEVDTMRDASAEPAREEMIEDLINPDQRSTEDVQLIDEDLLDDEDMVDGDTIVQNADANHEDFTMESHQEILPNTGHEDDDILYDDDDVIRQGNTEAQDTQDVEIVDGEDLFHEDEDVQEYPLEDPTHRPEVLHNKHDEQQTTNVTTQDAEDLENNQGPLFSGNFANNVSDPNDDDQTKVEYDISHMPDHATTTYSEVAAETKINQPATSPTDTADNTQTSDVLEPAKIYQADQSAADPVEDSPSIEASEFPTYENGSAKSADAGPPMGGAQVDDEDLADRQTLMAPLHTVKVNYQDTEICLFPPNEDDDSETFFLVDVDLAYQSLDKLLGACHDVLTGSIGDDDELVLDIPSLGLHISQDSSHATQITLSQVLDAYLALSHNAQPESVEPLYCHLSSRVSLASQYAYLLSAAEQGKTFAEIAAEHFHLYEDSHDAREDDQAWNHEHQENHENLGQVQSAETVEPEQNYGNAEHEDSGTTDSDLETVQTQGDSHADEERAPEDVFAKRAVSSSISLENGAESDGEGLAGDAENETSATSTVRGDIEDPQDFETSHEDRTQAAIMASAPGIYLEADVEAVGANDKAAEEEEDKVETQSAVGDTESSRTIEGSDDVFNPTPNVDADAEKRVLTYNNEDLQENVDTENPADAVAEPGNLDEFDYINAESAEVDDLDRNSQDFRQVLQSAKYSANTTAIRDQSAEFDHDDLLDDHGAHEHHDFLGHATDFDLAYKTAGDDTTARASEHENLSEVHRSNKITDKAEDARTVIQEYDNLLLEDGDTNTTAQEVTPPVTPSRSRPSKRKSRDDEDEFDLLESGTPDVKRRRPS